MLEKQESYTRIELTENGVVQLRLTTKILDDGKVISDTHHRTTVTPDSDISGLPDNVRSLCQAFWTDEVVAKYQASKPKKNTEAQEEGVDSE